MIPGRAWLQKGVPKALSPEAEILLSCARLYMDPSADTRLQTLLKENLDWDSLVRAAFRHGVLPLVHRSLSRVARGLVPAAVMAQLREATKGNVVRNLLLTRELLKIISLLEAEGIGAVPFKGPALASFVYGDLSLRQFSDLDLLVRRADVSRARELLASLGYLPDLVLSGSQEQAFIDSFYHYELENPSTGVLVEIHWEVSRWHTSFPLDLDDLWPRLERRTLEGMRVLNLCPEDLLLVICAHSAKHSWNRLGWVSDAVALIETNPDLDWTVVLERAHRLGGKRLLFLGLFLARELLGATLPKAVWGQILADPQVKKLAQQVQDRLFLPDHQPRFLADNFFYLRALEGWKEKIRFCQQFAFSPTANDLAFLPLPRGLFFLYVFFRPFRLALQYGMRRKTIPGKRITPPSSP